MVEYLTEREANYQFPGWEEYPNISKTGSLRGMRDRFNWDLKKVRQIGNYYYNLRGHPAFKKEEELAVA